MRGLVGNYKYVFGSRLREFWSILVEGLVLGLFVVLWKGKVFEELYSLLVECV